MNRAEATERDGERGVENGGMIVPQNVILFIRPLFTPSRNRLKWNKQMHEKQCFIFTKCKRLEENRR